MKRRAFILTTLAAAPVAAIAHPSFSVDDPPKGFKTTPSEGRATTGTFS